MTATTAAPAHPRQHEITLAASTLVTARRGMLKYLRTPQLLVLSLVQGGTFLLIFRYVFGGAVAGIGTLSYVDFLVPGFVATGVLFTGIGAAAGVAEDKAEGLIDRLRSLPMPRAAVLAGRAVSDTMIIGLGAAVSVGVGFAVGFRLHGSISAGLGAFALCTVYGFAFEWIFVLAGMAAANAQAAQGISFMVFPLTFVSSAYVPVATMPGWLQAFAAHQPVTYMVDSVRALTLGPAGHLIYPHAASYYVIRALLWSAAIIAVTAPLAIARYRRG
jgi:ABC-2 type transport system permease protein